MFAETQYLFCFLVDSLLYVLWINDMKKLDFWQKGQVPFFLMSPCSDPVSTLCLAKRRTSDKRLGSIICSFPICVFDIGTIQMPLAH